MTGPRLPSPYAPPDLDVRALPEMPLAVERLRDSDAAAILPAEAFRAAVLLWAAAWHELPAGTLPASDVHLAKLAGLGRDLTAWAELKAAALHGFVLCRDERWHHPLIVELAIRERSALRARQRVSAMQSAKAKRSHQARRALGGKAAQAAPGYAPADPAAPGFTLVTGSGAFAAGSIDFAAADAVARAAAAENGGKTATHNSEQGQALTSRGSTAAGAAAGETPASPPSPSSPSSVFPLRNPLSTPPPPSPSTPPPPLGLESDDSIPVAGTAGALDLLGQVPGKVRVQRSSATPPACPVQAIVEAYHAELPMCPGVRVLADTTRKALVTRWREAVERQTVEWWRGYFRHVATDCPFLVGKTHHNFRASLEWLVGPKNFAKVVNGNYDREDQA